MGNKENEFIDYLNVISKKKWLIIIGTLSSMLFAGVVSFILKPVYEIDAIIQPGKFLIEDRTGSLDEVVVESPQQIADKIDHRSYDALIASDLAIDLKRLPRVKAENIPNTLLIRIWIRDAHVGLAKDALVTLLKIIRNDIDKKISIEIDNIDTAIKNSEIQKETSSKTIGILERKLAIINQRKKDLVEEMAGMKERVQELGTEQVRVLKKDDRSEMESLALLLYSNELQESLRNYDYLNEKLKEERLDEENVASDIQKESATIQTLDNTIANLQERKGRFDYTKTIKESSQSLYPVFPKKKLNVLIAAILGFAIFTLFAFFLDYAESQKNRDAH